MNRAVALINEQMQKKAEDKQLEVIGQYLIDKAEGSAAAAGVLEAAFSTDEKALENAREAVKSEAKKVAINNMAMLGEDEVFAIVDKYFKLDAGAAPHQSASRPAFPKGEAFGGKVIDLENFL